MTIRGFNDAELDALHGAERHEAEVFNEEWASRRVVVEHAFGQLKGRFPYLRCLPGRDHKE